MYEFLSKPLQPKKKYYRRLFVNVLWAGGIIGFSLVLGMIGYHGTTDMSWLDALLNASMILTGMGPVNVLTTVGSKLFASFYAIYSGVVFLTTIAFVFTPVVHRFFHKFHLEDTKK